MIRVRSKSGRTIVVEEPLMYVEVLDGNGDVAMVFYREDFADGQAVSVVTPDMEEDASGYAKMFNVNWSNDIKGTWPKPEPVTVTKY